MAVSILNGSVKILNGSVRTGVIPYGIVLGGLSLFLDPNRTNSYPGTGTTYTDLSVYGNNGTLTNTPTFATDPSGGKYFAFNGTTQYIDLNAYASLDTSQATYQILIQDGNVPDVSLNRQAMARTNTNAGTFNIIKRVTTGAWGVNFRSNADPATAVNYNSSFITSTCYQLATATYDGSFIRFYINDGIDPVSQSAAGAIDTAGTATINVARNTTGVAYWTGSIGPILIYDRALTDREVAQNYNALSVGYPTVGIGCF